MTGPSAPDGPPRRVRIRRSPKVGTFLVLGLVVGVVVAAVLTLATPADGQYDTAQVFAYVALGLGPLGAAVFGLIAVVLDRIATRNARLVEVEHRRERDEEHLETEIESQPDLEVEEGDEGFADAGGDER